MCVCVGGRGVPRVPCFLYIMEVFKKAVWTLTLDLLKGKHFAGIYYLT